MIPFRPLQRSLQRCNISRFCGRYTFSDISLYCNPIASTYCPVLLLGCICRSAKIWRTTLEDYHRLSEFSGIVLTRCPKFDCKLHIICNVNITFKCIWINIWRKDTRHWSFHRLQKFHVAILTTIHHNYSKRLKSHPYWNAPRLQDLSVLARF